MKPTHRPPSAAGFATVEGPFRIYRNLTKNCWSVQHRTPKGWRVQAHQRALIAKDVDFVVYDSGRQRVLSTGHKNVHAYLVTSTLLTPDEAAAHQPVLDPWVPFTYDPRVHTTFVIKDTNKPIQKATAVMLTPDGRAFAHFA